jgi:Domain of unknown function (DUF4375)
MLNWFRGKLHPFFRRLAVSIIGLSGIAAAIQGQTSMSIAQNNDAWNNFVMSSHAEDYDKGDIKRTAAIAKNYMNQVNSGGINSFLTNNWDIDSEEVVAALNTIGAAVAAGQLKHVLSVIGVPMPAMSQDSRWNILDKHWADELNAEDGLSAEAEKDLMRALEQHVLQNEAFYLKLQ